MRTTILSVRAFWTAISAIRGIWAGRSDRYSEERTELLGTDRPKRVEMYQIGG